MLLKLFLLGHLKELRTHRTGSLVVQVLINVLLQLLDLCSVEHVGADRALQSGGSSVSWVTNNLRRCRGILLRWGRSLCTLVLLLYTAVWSWLSGNQFRNNSCFISLENLWQERGREVGVGAVGA